MSMRRGSALLTALWIILVLSVIAVSFSFEARLQGGINIYVQNKNRVKRLIESGRVIGEVVLANYGDAKQWSEDEDPKDLSEEDRWYLEKRALKYDSRCLIGPILLDETDPDSGTVEVEISMVHGENGGGLNINKLGPEDGNSLTRWQIILDMCGVPREDDFRTEEGKSINLQHYIIGCWFDYLDSDDSRTVIDDVECGAEKKEYEEYYDDHKKDIADENRYEPANAEIVDLRELARVLCFQEYPALLTGGVVNPWEDKDRQIKVTGLLSLGLFSTIGSAKVNVNDCTVEQLLTVPGIYDEDEVDEDDKEESRKVAEAIVKCRKIPPQDYDVPEEGVSEYGYGEYTSDWWGDLVKRVNDEFELEIGQDAQKYLTAQPEVDATVFKMKITARMMDMTYSAECECYVKEKKVRYVMWKE